MWVALSVAGLILQLVGVAVAMWGLEELSVELFGRRLPIRRLWLKIRAVLSGRSPVVIAADSGGGTISAGSVRAQVVRPRPADDAELPEWSRYLESRLDNFGERLDWIVEDARAANADLHARVSEESQRHEQRVRAVEEHLVTAVAGREGSGLAKAWWGLFITAAGMVLQGIAGFAL